MLKRVITGLRSLLSAQNGSIAVMGAIALTSMLGMSGLAVEVGNGYAAKVRNQRVTDLAALGAAMAYKTNGQSITVATQVAKDIVAANGITGTPTVEQVTMNAKPAIKVSVTTQVPIRLARMFSPDAASYNVTNSAYAGLVSVVTNTNTVTNTTTTGGGGCITTLNSGTTSISAKGGASITASGCSINTNGTIYSESSSAKVTAKTIS